MKSELEVAGRLPRQRPEVGDRPAHGVAAPAVDAGAVPGVSGVDRLDRQIPADLADDLEPALRLARTIRHFHRFSFSR